MKFSKFIPAYHVQYGEQCKLANYGCTKLVDLFEHISHIVEVTSTTFICVRCMTVSLTGEGYRELDGEARSFEVGTSIENFRGATGRTDQETP